MLAIKNHNGVIFFSFVYFLFCYAISLTWYYDGYFEVGNVFFQADPKQNLASFAHGWGRHTYIHAFIEIFSVPVRIVEFILSGVGLASNRIETRALIALAISPIFSALTLVFFHKILKQFKIENDEAVVFTLIFAASFSNVIFAIVPETYAISCFLISLLISHYLKCRGMEHNGGRLVWLTIAIFLAGTTITNISIFFLVFATHLLKNEKLGYFKAFEKASLYAVVAVLFVLIFYYSSNVILDFEFGTEGNPDWLALWTITSFYQAMINAVNLFSESINAFIAILPTASYQNKPYYNVTYYALSFTRNDGDYFWLSGVAIIILAFSFSSKKYITEKRWHDLYFISLPIIAYNFLLHIFFGREMFLYTQHWIIPLFLVLIPILSGKRPVSIALLFLLIGINFQFLFSVEEMISLK